MARDIGLILGFVVTLITGCMGGCIVGNFQGEQSAQRANFLREKPLVEAVLTADPAFSHLKIDEGPAGSLYLAGELGNQADHERLQAKLIQALGESVGKAVMSPVRVRRKSS